VPRKISRLFPSQRPVIHKTKIKKLDSTIIRTFLTRMTHEHQQESVKSIKVRGSKKDAINKLISGEAARHIFSTKIKLFWQKD
jgi:hypothetical protein